MRRKLDPRSPTVLAGRLAHAQPDAEHIADTLREIQRGVIRPSAADPPKAGDRRNGGLVTGKKTYGAGKPNLGN
jgi:hypothetical protein